MPGKHANTIQEGPDLPSLHPWGGPGIGWAVEDQDHLEVCPGYASQWAGLGPMTPRTRVQYYMRVDNKRRTKA